jgi:hypothetical protein
VSATAGSGPQAVDFTRHYEALRNQALNPAGQTPLSSGLTALLHEGVVAGVADLCLPAARRGYHGLYLEMKSEEGIATKEQKEFLRGVSGEGYCAVIAQGVDEARFALQWYLGITDHEPPSVHKTDLICQSHISGRQRRRLKKKK